MHEPYHRRLPHYMPPGATLFITYRLHGTVPLNILARLQEEHAQLIQQQVTELQSLEAVKKRLESKYFISFDQYLDRCEIGDDWLRNEEIAEVVKQSLHFGHGTLYELHAFCIMPNHVHALLTVITETLPFYKILQRMKTYSAIRANRLLNRIGQPFWQPESYDHVVRNRKSFDRIINYILLNPVKAGLVESWEDWPRCYYQYM